MVNWQLCLHVPSVTLRATNFKENAFHLDRLIGKPYGYLHFIDEKMVKSIKNFFSKIPCIMDSNLSSKEAIATR
jgi:hypothetical protein